MRTDGFDLNKEIKDIPGVKGIQIKKVAKSSFQVGWEYEINVWPDDDYHVKWSGKDGQYTLVLSEHSVMSMNPGELRNKISAVIKPKKIDITTGFPVIKGKPQSPEKYKFKPSPKPKDLYINENTGQTVSSINVNISPDPEKFMQAMNQIHSTMQQFGQQMNAVFNEMSNAMQPAIKEMTKAVEEYNKEIQKALDKQKSAPYTVDGPADSVLSHPLLRKKVNCPSLGCHLKDKMQSMIIHMNDEHKYTREQIADWLDTLDEQPVFYPAVNDEPLSIGE